jgi:outer membrane protein assembly factor BamB
MVAPQFRGPSSSGVGEGRSPVHFGTNQKVVWKAVVGSGLSSPSIWKGHIFLTEFDRTNNQLATLCLDRRSGKILWRRMVAAGEIEKGSRNQ